MKIKKEEGNKIWIDTQLGWGDENQAQYWLNDPQHPWYGKIKFIYLTVFREYLNGEYCGTKWQYRISKSSTTTL